MKKRILLADDDFAVRESLSRVLSSEGFEVVLARSGHEVILEFMSCRPDLVLLDLNMPDKDGWQAYDAIERTRPLTPVILITALSHQHTHAAWLGIDAIMEKPLDLSRLLSTINRLLAESPQKRLVRLTRGDFKTEYLHP